MMMMGGSNLVGVTPFENGLEREGYESQHHEQRGNGKGSDILIVVIERLDVQRHGFGQATNMARNHRHRAELAHGARVAKQHAIEQAPFYVGKCHMPESAPAAGSQRDRSLLLVASLVVHQRNELARDERECHEDRCQYDSWKREDDADVVIAKPLPQPTLQSEDQCIDEARHNGRDRKRQIDQRDEKTLAPEIELGDGPGGRDAKDRIQRHGDGSGDQRQAVGRQSIRLGDGAPRSAEPVAECFLEDCEQRQKKKQDDIDQGKRGQAEANQYMVLGRAARFEERTHRRDAVQAWSRLSIRSMTNEMASMMTPMTAAPA